MKISKKEFAERASIHQYGRGTNKIMAVFFDWLSGIGGGGYKYMFVFTGYTKKQILNEVYNRIFLTDAQYEALPNHIHPRRIKIAETDEQRFKVPLVMNIP